MGKDKKMSSERRLRIERLLRNPEISIALIANHMHCKETAILNVNDKAKIRVRKGNQWVVPDDNNGDQQKD